MALPERRQATTALRFCNGKWRGVWQNASIWFVSIPFASSTSGVAPGPAHCSSPGSSADAARLALKPNCATLIWSNLMLHWLNEPLAAMHEMHRVLECRGLLMFTTFGPDTLKELRAAFADMDGSPHVHEFMDMHDIGDMLMTVGFAEPVMDMELIKLTYSDARGLLRELKASGSTNAAATRRRGLTGARGWHRALSACDSTRIEGRVPATFEVIYGHAWKPHQRVAADGRAIVRFAPKARGE